MSDVVVRVIGLADGRPSPVDGQWLVEYDPTRAGVGVDGRVTVAHLVCAADAGSARRFSSPVEAFEYVRRESGLRRGPGGGPDRPLMAYHLATFALDADGAPVGG